MGAKTLRPCRKKGILTISELSGGILECRMDLSKLPPRRPRYGSRTAPITLPKSSGWRNRPRIRAVSYTHLDVYKRQGYGELRIRQELARRGVARETAEEALQPFSPDRAKLRALLDKRLHGDVSDRREVEKAVAALQRRGFSWPDIRAALAAYGQDLPDTF